MRGRRVKARVDRATTSRILDDIADAVRPVERARTTAAVDRVLATASAGCSEMASAFVEVTKPVAGSLGVEVTWLGDNCPYCSCYWDREYDELPGLHAEFDAYQADDQRERYAPWNVSPHLFDQDASHVELGGRISAPAAQLAVPGVQVQSTRPSPRREAAAAAPTPAALDTRPPENADSRSTPATERPAIKTPGA
jgi:hypothetical protein